MDLVWFVGRKSRTDEDRAFGKEIAGDAQRRGVCAGFSFERSPFTVPVVGDKQADAAAVEEPAES